MPVHTTSTAAQMVAHTPAGCSPGKHNDVHIADGNAVITRLTKAANRQRNTAALAPLTPDRPDSQFLHAL